MTETDHRYPLSMCFYGRTNSDGVLWRLARLILCITLQFGLKDRVESHNAPSRADFAKCTLSTEDREKFVDEHNRLRGMVSPQAADMEFLVRSKLNKKEK